MVRHEHPAQRARCRAGVRQVDAREVVADDDERVAGVACVEQRHRAHRAGARVDHVELGGSVGLVGSHQQQHPATGGRLDRPRVTGQGRCVAHLGPRPGQAGGRRLIWCLVLHRHEVGGVRVCGRPVGDHREPRVELPQPSVGAVEHEEAAAGAGAQVERLERHVGRPQLLGPRRRLVEVEDQQPRGLLGPDDEVVVLGDRQPRQRPRWRRRLRGRRPEPTRRRARARRRRCGGPRTARSRRCPRSAPGCRCRRRRPSRGCRSGPPRRRAAPRGSARGRPRAPHSGRARTAAAGRTRRRGPGRPRECRRPLPRASPSWLRRRW